MEANPAVQYPAVPLPAARHQPILVRDGVRRSIWVAFVLAIANGVFLYFLPGQANAHYAWPIKPSVNAAFMGAGYLAGVLPTALGLFVARYWRSIRSLIWSFFAIGSVMLLATIIHADRFRWHYPPTWAWTAVYVIIPPATVLIWFGQRRMGRDQPPADARLRGIAAVSWPLGSVVALLGLALFLAPDRMVAVWPWQVTPLLARAFAAWYLQIATTLLICAATLRQPHEALVPYAWLTLFNALLIVLPLLYAGSMRTNFTSYWLWLGLHAVLLVTCGVAAYRAWRLMRAEGQRL